MINDFLSSASSSLKLKYSPFADDCAIWTSSHIRWLSVEQVQKELTGCTNGPWSEDVSFLPINVKVYFVQDEGYFFNLFKLGSINIAFTLIVRLLGLYFGKHLNQKAHVNHLDQPDASTVTLLKYLLGPSWGADWKSLLMIYKSLVWAKLEFGAQVCGYATCITQKWQDVIQNQCIKICFGAL